MTTTRRLNLRESLTVEFKSDRRKLSDDALLETVVALANTDGGDIYLGVEADGKISGLHKDHLDPTPLAALIANKTVPSVSVRTEVQDYSHPILKISVPRSLAIVATSSGKILRRRIKADGTPETIPLYPYEITSRLSDLRLLDFSAQAVPDAKYEDLDAVERERLRNIIRNNRGEQVLLSLTEKELDQALRLVTTIGDETVPTLTGLLLIGRIDRLAALVPTAEASIQVLEGTDIVVNESFCLPILNAFEKIKAHIEARNRETEMEEGLFRISIPDIDPGAFREALVNAFSHRDYSMLGRTIVRLDNQGLTISNPGGFIEGVSIDSLLDAEPHGRNPALADALKRIGLAERTGRGIDRIFAGSLHYGRLPPNYRGSSERKVRLFIPKGVPDKTFVSMIVKEQQRIGRTMPIYSLVVLNSLRQMQRATVHDIYKDVKLDEARVKTTLENLVTSGLVEAIGVAKRRSYRLSSRVYKKADDLAGYIRQSDIDEIRFEELVLKLVKEQGRVRRGDVVELLHIEPSQAYRVLRGLVDADQLVLVGRGRYAHYVLK